MTANESERVGLPIVCSQLLLTLAVVLFVFVPWLGRYVDGQFLGLTGEYGTDFFRYAMGSEALLRLGEDPYSNAGMFELLESEQLKTGHPNQEYDPQTSIKAFADTPEPVAKGVVSPPFLLVVIAPWLLLGYTTALNTWVAATLLGMGGLCWLFWRRLQPPRPWLASWSSYAAVIALLVCSGFPVLWVAIYGQFEALYVLPVAGAIYLWVWRPERPSTPLLVGLLTAFAGAVKLFPLILLGYFAWRALLAVRTDNGNPFGWLQVPEMKVVLWGTLFFAAFNAATAATCGVQIYQSFLTKSADLQLPATGPSMKGNLLSYLSFLPFWMSSPFRAPAMWPSWVYLLAVAATATALLRTCSRECDSWRRLLNTSLLLAALPTLMPHWWIYYNVVLMLPLMVCFAASRRASHASVRRWLLALTVLAFALNYSYLTTSLFFGACPDVYASLVNRPAVDAAISQLDAEPHLAANLPYSRALGEPYVAELEGRVPSVFNLVYGYPGALLLLIAGLIAAHCRYEAVAAP
ncbi:MAG: DUF2029 domain-containing protein, partial [Planctomycetales bacterium]|nr:DUF2029 domain-containing protein [Planctomycetales bacterium]